MPNYYTPYYYPQPIPQQVSQPQPVQQTQQIQNTGFVTVRSETEARNYPVGPGNSITFKDETAPYVYTKTMGFSQFDQPIFEKFKLIKENPTAPAEQKTEEVDLQPINERLDEIKAEIVSLWDEMENIKKKLPKPAAKKREEKEGDDNE